MLGASLRQRCLSHRAEAVKADYWGIFNVPAEVEPGDAAVKCVQDRIDAFALRWRDSYPAAVRILATDRDSLTSYLHFPREHWTRVRHSNFIERSFGDGVKRFGGAARRRRCFLGTSRPLASLAPGPT